MPAPNRDRKGAAITFFILALYAPQAAAADSLTIEQPAVHASEDGPVLPRDYRFRPADTVYFSFQVAGYQKTGDDQIKLTWHISVDDPKSVALVESSHGSLATQVSQEDKHWMPIARRSFVVPPFAPGGQYRIRLSVTDELSHKEAALDMPFLVEGRDVAASDALVIRNFRFLRGEDDKEPLESAAYRLGETLWVRFDITGYKFAEANRYSVEYGVRVLRQDGSTAYAQPEAAQSSNSSFYPRRYVPGVFSLNIPKDLHKGIYAVVVSAADEIGHQTCEAKQNFSVE